MRSVAEIEARIAAIVRTEAGSMRAAALLPFLPDELARPFVPADELPSRAKMPLTEERVWHLIDGGMHILAASFDRGDEAAYQVVANVVDELIWLLGEGGQSHGTIH